MRSSHHRKSEPLHATLVGAVVAAMAISAIIGSSLRLAEALRPRNGDIIAFAPVRGDPVAAQPNVVAQRAGRSPAAFCILDPRVMLQSGGSLIVEAASFTGGRGYRVHWAGGRTSAANTDCGQSAELQLTLGDVTALTLAADGQADHPTVDYNRPGIGRRVR